MYLNASKVPEFSDDLTELQCRVVDMKSTEPSVRVTVSWYYRMNRRSDDVVTSELLAVMDGDWTLRYGERSKQRAQDGDFIFSKERTDTFSFRIQRTTEEDRGNYYCVVSAWTRQRNDSWVKSKDVFSKPVHIFWASEGGSFVLVLYSCSVLSPVIALYVCGCVVTPQGAVCTRNPGKACSGDHCFYLQHAAL